MVKLFLGVDGGQSSTTALIGDEGGRAIGEGHAGPCNHASAGEGRARFHAALTESVSAALERTGLKIALKDAEFESACFGFSGGPADKEALTRKLVKAAQYFITHDAWIALTGATGGEPGAIVIAGTGSMAFGRNAEGRTARAGGWGYIFGDEGGAFDLVRQALRGVVRHEEGWGPRTSLREALLEATGAADANDLLHRFYSEEFPRERIAALAPLVEGAASSGDAVAQEILSRAAQDLATLLAAVRAQLFRQGEAALVSYAGGVFENAAIRERFRLLTELDGGNRVLAPRDRPAMGALIEAYRVARKSNA